MKAASREALATAQDTLDSLLKGADAVADSARTGLDLFEVVGVLDGNRELRVALNNTAASAEARKSLVNTLFGQKLSSQALRVVEEAAQLQWSSARDLVKGLVVLGRRALLRGAEAQGQLGMVEDELFRLSRILDREGELTQLLTDRSAESARKRGLLANVLYGKVTMFTEALALQAIDRPEQNPVDDIAGLASDAASLQGRTIAFVTTAVEMNESQQAELANKLGNIYGRAMSIHSEVDTSLLGGMTIRVGEEVIDGSTKGKIERLRTAMA
ncbi:ATP F0F1 synthase subunit delta [Corynebacterium phocae]|uniref:ATP synthase subunit delta n=1 Tax=Corynebacterium phocae TaxID=161895 RepID=A0A1L7D3W4_9CORY|nr:F0F1 ATP synthase subunit delta [Corynebacterium phocae]APT92763.1 ATP F0F1 synthase subunit delta [Corynebacterium phocae]KAA8723074.1 F0F1 ATP synthase subunit delta [Corynebacterium phocae]